jgi:hypothetical protein
MIVLYILAPIAATIFLASIIPLSQYFYYTYIKKGGHSIRYYLSENLFNRHLNENPNMVRVINNRDDMSKLWEKEIAHKLP